MKLHNLEPLKDCNINKGRTRKYLPIVTGKRQKVVSPWLVGKWVGGRGVGISLKKQKLSFRIFVVEESPGWGNNIKSGPRMVLSGELLAEASRETSGKDKMSPEKDSKISE